MSSLSGVLALVREQVRSHSGIHTGESGPRGREQKRSVAVPLFISLPPAVGAAKGPPSTARALIRAPAAALPDSPGASSAIQRSQQRGAREAGQRCLGMFII